MPNPPPNVKKLIALLAWVTPSNAAEFYGKIKAQQDSTLIADRERMKWKAHPLYAENTKSQLEALCQTLRIPVTPSVTKHQMVSLIAQRRRNTRTIIPTNLLWEARKRTNNNCSNQSHASE